MFHGELDWIVLKSLEKNRSRRYESASSFAADIERLIQNKPVAARPTSTLYRMSKFSARNRSLVVTVATIVLLIVGGVSGMGWFAYRAEQARIELQAMLESLWDVLTDVALDAAFSGDYDEAVMAIERADRAHAPKDLTRTLNGIALFFNGRTAAATTELEDVIEEKPNSRVALSALAWIYHHSAEPGKHSETRKKVEVLVADNDHNGPYELLFLSLNRFVHGSTDDLRDTLQDLDELIRDKSRWGVAYSLRANARMELGMETKSIEDFRAAINDIEHAQTLIPKSPFVTSIGLHIYIAAIELAKDQGVEHQTWIDRGLEIASSVDFQRDAKLSCTRAAVLHYRIGNKEMGESIEALYGNRIEKYGIIRFGFDFENICQNQRATANLESELRTKGDHPEIMLSLALLLACSDDSSKRKEALDIFFQLGARDLPLGYHILSLDIPMILGEQESSHKLLWKVLKHPDLENEWRWWKYWVQYYAGEMYEDELIEHAGPFSRGDIAYYAIAMTALANGDRAKAMKYLAKTRDSRRVGSHTYHWSKVLLRQMAENPKWPPQAEK